MALSFEYTGLCKIISGGQIGVDQGALHAAVDAGVATGGFAPKGWRTQRGPQPLLEALYLVQHPSKEYKDRTISNIRQADATLVLATSTSTPGTALTIREAHRLQKPILILSFHSDARDNIGYAAEFIKRHQVRCLNVAGNRDEKDETLLHEAARLTMREVLIALDLDNLLVRGANI